MASPWSFTLQSACRGGGARGGVWGFLIGAALSFHNRNLIIGQTVELVNKWDDFRFISQGGREFLQQRLLETKNRVDESEFVVVIKQDIVTVLSYVGHKDIVIAECISSIRAQSKPVKMFRNLIVIWADICANRFLPKDKTCLMAILPYAKEIKSAIRKKNIMDDMFKQHIFWRMLLEMQLGEWILDFVIDLLFLDQAHFTFTGSYGVSRTGNLRHVDKTSRLLCRRNQRAARLAYRIRRQRPSISASFIGACSRKHSNAADIRYGPLADGRDRMKDSTLSSIPSRYRPLSSSGMITSFEKV